MFNCFLYHNPLQSVANTSKGTFQPLRNLKQINKKETMKVEEKRTNKLNYVKKDHLLYSALKRLFNLYVTEKAVRESCRISRGAWDHFFKGKAREGVRLAIIFTAAKKAIERDLGS